MKRASNKILSFALACVMAIGVWVAMPPMPARAATSLAMNNYLYFGKYDGSPILWKVTGVNGNEATLLSEYVLYNANYHNSHAATGTDDTSLRTFTNTELGSTLNGSFKTNCFTVGERGAISDGISIPMSNLGSATMPNGNNAQYWYGLPYVTSPLGQGDHIWYAAFVDSLGDGVGSNVDDGGVGVRPALSITLTSAIFTSGFSVPAVVSATGSETGHTVGNAPAGGLTVAVTTEQAQTSDTVTLELLDSTNTAAWTSSTIGVPTNAASVTMTQAELNGLAVGTYTFRVTLKNSNGLSIAQYTSTAVDYTVSAVPTTATTDSDSEPTYTNRTLTGPSGITVSGQLAAGARLNVRERVLHAEGACPACDEIRARIAAGELIVLYDISVTGGYTGDLEVSIPVGEQYNGQTVTILHCNNGKLESVTCVVQNGVAKGTFKKLSPFAVVGSLRVGVPENTIVDPPKTGDAPIGGVAGIALVICALGMMAVVRRKQT